VTAPWLKYRQAEPAAFQAVEHPAPSEPVKGRCCDCGLPVTWHGPLAGPVNAFGDPIHLRCPGEPTSPHPAGASGARERRLPSN
jgi:hypothetical protein